MRLDASRLSARDRKLLDTLWFLVRLMLLSIPLYAVLWLNTSLLPLQHAVASHSQAVLNAAGIETSLSGLIVTAGAQPGAFIFYIGPDCTGWKAMLLFSALVLATLRVGLRKRLAGLAVGIPLVYAGNIARIASLVLAERAYGQDVAVALHDVLWQPGLVALVLALWIAWLRHEDIASAARRALRAAEIHIIGKKKQ